jgi:hypothetical protein
MEGLHDSLTMVNAPCPLHAVTPRNDSATERPDAGARGDERRGTLRRRTLDGVQMTPRLAVPAAVLLATLLLPAGTSAATYICPDGMGPVPVSAVPDGAKKDRNGNGFVCAKYADDGVKGGPDDKPSDVTDDIVL